MFIWDLGNGLIMEKDLIKFHEFRKDNFNSVCSEYNDNGKIVFDIYDLPGKIIVLPDHGIPYNPLGNYPTQRQDTS